MFSSHCLCRGPAARKTARALQAAVLTVCLLAAAGNAYASPPYASIVVDQHSGRVLYARNPDARRYPASLTKIMTLYLLFERLKAGKLSLDSRLRVSTHAQNQPPSKLGLRDGQTIRVVDAIRALVTKSANDVAVVVAESIAGTESDFARLMTVRARQIGMTRTAFRNASGLPDNQQVTTARDMATLSRRIMQDFPQYYPYFSLKNFSYQGRRYRNHNALLFHYRGTDGIKTGYTRASGFNLAASVKRGHKHLVAVVFGGTTPRRRNQIMQGLLNRSFPRAVAEAPRRDPVPAPPLPAKKPTPPQAVAAIAPPAAPITASLPPGTLPLRPPEGTLLDHREPAAVLAEPGPEPQHAGGYHVQVGAFSSHSEAIERLNDVQARALKVLEGHPPLALPLPKPKRYLFRARFAGFSEEKARRACDQLRRRSINCIVMRAE